MQYITDEQKSVVEYRLSQGYELFGKTKSLLNGLDAYVVNKGRHLMVINSLGYDEHTQGKTWRIYE
jgi:hypothetical protein